MTMNKSLSSKATMSIKPPITSRTPGNRSHPLAECEFNSLRKLHCATPPLHDQIAAVLVYKSRKELSSDCDTPTRATTAATATASPKAVRVERAGRRQRFLPATSKFASTPPLSRSRILKLAVTNPDRALSAGGDLRSRA